MIDALIRLVSKRPQRIEYVCLKLNVSEKEVHAAVKGASRNGYALRIRDGYVQCAVPVSAESVVKLGSTKPGRYTVALISDTHFGSSHCDEEGILKFLRHAWARGARVAYFTGDLLDGNRPVLLQDQRYVGCESQCARAVKTIKAAPKFQWVAIDGNHDGYYSASSGFICGKLTEAEMQSAGVDWTFAGVCLGRAVLHGAKHHLWHPHGGAGTRNAVRRVLNERAEGLNEPCDILTIGHFHRYVSFQAYPENVHCIGAGTFQQKASEFANRISRAWDIGGVLVSHTLDKAGRVSEIATDFCGAEVW